MPSLRNEENHSEDIFFVPNEPSTSALEYSPEVCQKLIGFSNRRVNTGGAHWTRWRPQRLAVRRPALLGNAR